MSALLRFKSITFMTIVVFGTLVGCMGASVELGDDPPVSVEDPDCGTPDASASEDSADAADESPPDAEDDGATCAGTCIPRPKGWLDPVLLWSGPKEEAPSCPAFAPALVYEGNAGLVAPSDCRPCTCGPPTGACGIPRTLTAAAATCAGDGPGVEHLSFDAPASWEGYCTAVNAIPAGSAVQSLTIAPLEMTEDDCMPETIEPGLKEPTPSWGTHALACSGEASSPCKNGDFCLSTAEPPPEGFRVCVFHEGLSDRCPEGYPDQRVFYDDYADTRACSDCACAPPTGSLCSTRLSVYSDNACEALQAAPIVTSAQAACVDLMPSGTALGSKSAEAATYTPGICAPFGGEPIGTASVKGPSTFCCRD
jgi:hypothetical protein